MIKLICAYGINGEFGLNDGLPWECPEDLNHFKGYTSGCILVASGSTFSTLPRKLPGRPCVVLSDRESVAKNGDEPDYIVPEKTSLEALCRLLEGTLGTDVCVIGGRELLLEASGFVDEASVTEMSNSYEATHYINNELLEDKLLDRLEWDSRWISDEAELFTYKAQ